MDTGGWQEEALNKQAAEERLHSYLFNQVRLKACMGAILHSYISVKLYDTAWPCSNQPCCFTSRWHTSENTKFIFSVWRQDGCSSASKKSEVGVRKREREAREGESGTPYLWEQQINLSSCFKASLTFGHPSQGWDHSWEFPHGDAFVRALLRKSKHYTFHVCVSVRVRLSLKG